MSVIKKTIMNETKVALIEQNLLYITTTLMEIKTDFKEIKSDISKKIEKLDARMDRIEIKLQENFKWIIGVIITLFSGLYATALGGMIARLCHWI